jgi:hypothetical protein
MQVLFRPFLGMWVFKPAFMFPVVGVHEFGVIMVCGAAIVVGSFCFHDSSALFESF